MIDYSSYNKIREYITNNDIDKLKEYIDDERDKYYLRNAKRALEAFSIDPMFHYTYLEDGRLVIINNASFYILNSDEILTPALKGKGIAQIPATFSALKKLEEAKSNCKYDVVSINTNEANSRESILRISESSKLFIFKKSYMEQSRLILGEEKPPVYNLNKDKNYPMCLVSSNKGEGVILGLRMNKKKR